MALTVKKNTAIAIEEEVTEGVYVAPSAATSFLQTLADGTEIKPSKELLERNIFNGSLGKTAPRTGTRTVSGSVPVECRAFSAAGGAPEYNSLLKSAFGSRRQSTTQVTTKASPAHTSTIIQIQDADIAKFQVGDIVKLNIAGAHHVSPITAKTSGAGVASITLLVANPAGIVPASAVIEKFTTYNVANTGHPSLSITKYVDSAVREYGVGCRTTSMSLENFSTGQIPSLNFGFEGLDFDRSLTAPSYTPSYDAALPPIVLDARLYMDGASIDVNEVAFSLENSLGFSTSIASQNGRISGRAVERTVSGTFNPYKQDNSIANYSKFKNNTAFSLFAYAKVPTATAGEFGQVVAFYMPNCIITELGEADQDGLLQETISFSANRGPSGTTDEIVFTTI